jgi:DNA replication protein DnaC
MPRLFEDMARLDGRFPRLVDKLSRVQLLMLDDWGTHGLTDQQRLDLLELFEERYRGDQPSLRPSSPSQVGMT